MITCRRCPIRLTKPPETLGEHMDDMANKLEDLGLTLAPVEALRRHLLAHTMAAIAHDILGDE